MSLLDANWQKHVFYNDNEIFPNLPRKWMGHFSHFQNEAKRETFLEAVKMSFISTTIKIIFISMTSCT